MAYQQQWYRSSSNPAVHLAQTQEEARAAVAAELRRQLTVPANQLRPIADHIVREMEKGAAEPGHTLAMLPSFVTGRCTGKETGTYYALDLGGTNLRVCAVTLNGDGTVSLQHQKYVIPERAMTSTSDELFDFIAECVGEFLRKRGTTAGMTEEAVLGFTFSFPFISNSIDSGILTHWTKGFNAKGTEGMDVVKLLQEAFVRHNLKVKVICIINDTVGTLVAHAYAHPKTQIGIIMGTGCNAAYYESMDKISKWKGKKVDSGEMIINIEWGAFDNERQVLPLTQFDNKLDRESINVGEQIFEKMVAGMYLGEIVRNIFISLIDRGFLFEGQSAPALNRAYGFDTSLMSQIEVDDTEELEYIQDILEERLGLQVITTLKDRKWVKEIVQLVGTRAARLCAAAITALLDKREQNEDCDIGIDGSLFQLYPSFKKRLTDAMTELMGEARVSNTRLGLARDGSGVGAAIIAMLADNGGVAVP